MTDIDTGIPDGIETPEAYALVIAWRLGFAAGEHAIATRLEALEGCTAWEHVPAPTWEEQVARRNADAEERAELHAMRTGRPRDTWVGLDNGAQLPVWDEDEDDLAVAA